MAEHDSTASMSDAGDFALDGRFASAVREAVEAQDGDAISEQYAHRH